MIKKFLKRKFYSKMLEWKKSGGATALLIQGARRVGKSTIAEEFAKNEYSSYIRIDFSDISQEINRLFDDMSDIDGFFLKLQAFTGISLKNRKSVIIFDEIQLQPKARQAIKHLVADGRYDYIETGSLISIQQNVKDIVIPSEEHRLNLYPFDYEEFRWALGDEATIPLLRDILKRNTSLGDDVNRKLMRDFRLYMIVGGMPQVVNEYLNTNDLALVDACKRSILDLYSADFKKIDKSGRLSMLFNAIPSELNRNAGRYSVSEIIDGARTDRMLPAIAEMADSMTVNVAYLANDPNIGMLMHKDITRYKLYLCDTGLFVTLAFQDKDVTSNELYRKLLSDKLHADLGYVYENVVAQMLRASGNSLYYYTFPTGNGNSSYEVDFLISKRDKICPIEVKSSGYRTHASLDAFCEKYPSRIQDKYLIYTKDFRKDRDITLLPVYMTGLI